MTKGIWGSTYKAIFLALLILQFSGCRLGNNVENNNSGSSNLYGYFGAEAQELRLGVYLNGEAEDEWINADVVNHIPSLMTEVMSNPIGIMMVPNGEEGLAQIFNPTKNPSPALVTQIDTATGEINFKSATDWSTLWDDDACKVKMSIEELGNAKKKNNATINGFETSGRVDLEILFVHNYTSGGACQPTFTKIKKCYEDVNDCGGGDAETNQSNYAESHRLLDPYINSGLIATSDIHRIEALGYYLLYK